MKSISRLTWLLSIIVILFTASSISNEVLADEADKQSNETSSEEAEEVQPEINDEEAPSEDDDEDAYEKVK